MTISLIRVVSDILTSTGGIFCGDSSQNGYARVGLFHTLLLLMPTLQAARQAI